MQLQNNYSHRQNPGGPSLKATAKQTSVCVRFDVILEAVTGN